MTVITQDDLRPLLPGLTSYARYLCRGGHDAEDLLQATLTRAVAKQDRFDGTNLKGWLGTLMHNEHVNRVRSSSRLGPHVPVDEVLGLRAEGTSTGLDRLAVRDVGRAIDALPEEQSSVILLIVLEGMTYREAADALRIPVGTVRSRLSRGRDALRDVVDHNREAA